MPKRLKMTIVCFHIVAVLAIVEMLPITFGMWFAGEGAPVYVLVAVPLMCMLSAVAVELVVRGLKQFRHKYWVAGIVISGLLIVTGLESFLVTTVLGGLALWGLLDPDTVKAFKQEQVESAL